jgi:cation:H+ antiporter
MNFDSQALITAFVTLWIGSGFVISTIDRLAKRLRLSSFLVSFFLLGFATSTPELAVGITSLLKNQPQVFVGNYVGGALVILLFIIPILAIIGKGVDLKHHISPTHLLLTLSVIALPMLVTIDSKLTHQDAVICLAGYALLYFFVRPNKSMADRFHFHHLFKNKKITSDVIKVGFGISLVFIASNVIVSQTTILGDLLHLSPFIMGLFMLAFGTNMIEMSIAIRSVIMNKKAVAFGNYLGSAAFNTLLMGIMILPTNKNIAINNHTALTLSTFLIGLVLFFIFAKSKHTISRKEGFILITLYLTVAFAEIVISPRL